MSSFLRTLFSRTAATSQTKQDPVKVQIKGLIRFSYPSIGGFAGSVEDLDARRAVLYDPDRLALRFRYFENITFHTLALQSDPDFVCGILIGPCFPDAARARLELLIADLPQLKIVTLPPMVHSKAARAAFDALPDQPGTTHRATIRLDDDDGLHAETIARIRHMSETLIVARDTTRPFIIGFNRGFYMDPASERPISEWYEFRPLGIGLTMVAPKEQSICIYSRNHRKVGAYFDCYTDVGRPMWIRSVHKDNDSAAEPYGRRGKLTDRQIKKALWTGFGLTAGVVDVL
ncbi:MAG: glycosyltransferase [Pseudomonadota bacterium]